MKENMLKAADEARLKSGRPPLRAASIKSTPKLDLNSKVKQISDKNKQQDSPYHQQSIKALSQIRSEVELNEVQ